MRSGPSPRTIVASTALILLLLATGGQGIPTGDGTLVPLRDLVDDPEATLYDWMTPDQVARLQSGESLPLEETPFFDEVQERLQDPGEEDCHDECYLDEPLDDLPLPYTRIRPGSPLGITQRACTANYVFEQGDRLAIGNAGHCTRIGRVHQASILNLDTLAIELVTFGTTIMQIYGGLGTDFALIEVHPEHRSLIHPAIAGLDGPCGWRATIGTGDPIQFHGHGTDNYGYHGQNRHGVVQGYSANHISYHRLPGGAGGDSGSPVRFVTNSPDAPTVVLGAAGINTHGTIGNPQFGHGTSAPRIMQLIEAADVGNWNLVHSPNCPSLAG